MLITFQFAASLSTKYCSFYLFWIYYLLLVADLWMNSFIVFLLLHFCSIQIHTATYCVWIYFKHFFGVRSMMIKCQYEITWMITRMVKRKYSNTISRVQEKKNNRNLSKYYGMYTWLVSFSGAAWVKNRSSPARP